jgi:hypothetical protein
MWTGPQIEAESLRQQPWDALEAKTGSTREGENRSGGHGGGERGKPSRRGRATNTIPTLQLSLDGNKHTEITFMYKLVNFVNEFVLDLASS